MGVRTGERSRHSPGVSSVNGPTGRGSRLEEVVPAASEYEQRLQEYEREVTDLQDQLKALEEEVVGLRRRLQDAPKRVRTLEERLLETKGQLAQALSQNEKLSATLREAREHIAALREEVRQHVIARNERRMRQGKPPLDVEEEIDRQLRELGA